MLNSEAAILPRLVALGDIDEDELIFAQAASNAPETALELPPALDGLQRRLTLAQLIAGVGDAAETWRSRGQSRSSSAARRRRWRSPTISRA